MNISQSFFFPSLEIVKARNIETQVFLNAPSRVNEKKGRQSVTKRSNGRNLIVGGVRFDSGVECYGNKSVNKMRRDCLAANKPSRSFAKARREKEKERVCTTVLPRSYQLHWERRLNDLSPIFALHIYAYAYKC